PHRRVLPRRVVRSVRSMPHRHRAPGGGAAPPRERQPERRRARGALGPHAGDARHVHLRPRPDCGERGRVRDREPGSARSVTVVKVAAPKRLVELTIDGTSISVTEGSTILDACRRLGIETPTLCYADTLTPVNVCRVCVVELENARTLVPACSRKVEAGMVVLTDSERVRTSRRLVMELLGSATDLSTAPEALAYIERYDAQ